MESTIREEQEEEPLVDFSPLMKLYKNGRIERLRPIKTVPPTLDPNTNVESKDTLYSPQHNLSVRLYLPKTAHQNPKKLPLFIYFHGGAFLLESPFSPVYHSYLPTIASEAEVLGVSVDYRIAPEHYVPAAYEDSWTALKWVASHFNQNGPEEWINKFADFNRVFLSGDSAGANISHRLAMKHGNEEKLEGINIEGIILCHPYFLGSEDFAHEKKNPVLLEKVRSLWKWSCPTSSGLDDVLINPAFDPNLGRLGCGRVQVIVSEKDMLKERGWYYAQKLRESCWVGDLEVVDFEGEDHIFHLFNSTCEKARLLRRKIVGFINLEGTKA